MPVLILFAFYLPSEAVVIILRILTTARRTHSSFYKYHNTMFIRLRSLRFYSMIEKWVVILFIEV